MQIWKRQQLWLLLELGAIKLDCEIASFHDGMVKAKKTCKPNIILGKLLTNLAGMNLMPLETSEVLVERLRNLKGLPTQKTPENVALPR
jgi:hypothetical protein